VAVVEEVRTGKIVYRPPEKCFARVKIEETSHGYRLYHEGADRHFMVIPLSNCVSVEYKE
jgi:hypothetical protein